MSRTENGDGGFLGRWAKRKQEVQFQSKQEQNPSAPDLQTSPALPATQEQATAPESAEAELPLPSLDDVLPGGDISVFLQKNVPDALRNAALRKAWLADPDISGFIEMADYQWDFTRPDSIPGWGSSLQGVDVKGMVEKVFNNVAAPKDAVQNEAEIIGISDSQEAATKDENIIMDTENSGKQPVLPQNSSLANNETSHVAVQENPTDSAVYGIIKKRHGGALPY